jgi:O-antigen/teichoic acid export membrane protein
MTGATVSQIITLVALPFLTRLFTPAEFGVIAVYISIANILATLSTGRYESAIMLPANEAKAFSVMILSFVLVVFTAAFFFLLLLIFNRPLAAWLNLSDHAWLLYYLPVSILIMGGYKSLNYWFNRKKSYKMLAGNRIAQTSVTSSVNLLAGFFTRLGAAGLFAGHLTGQFMQSFLLLRRLRRPENMTSWLPRKSKLKKLAREYRNFPIFSMPMGVLNALSADLLVYLLAMFYNSTLVGFYSNASKVVNYPLVLINSAFSSVFYQRMSESANRRRLFRYSYFINLILAALLLAPIMIWGKEIFAFVLGSDWAMAGDVAAILAPWAVAGYAARNVSTVFSLTKRNQYILAWQVIYLIGAVTLVLILKSENIFNMLGYFSGFATLMYLLLAGLGYLMLIRDEKKSL